MLLAGDSRSILEERIDDIGDASRILVGLGAEVGGVLFREFHLVLYVQNPGERPLDAFLPIEPDVGSSFEGPTWLANIEWTFSFMCANVDIRDLSVDLGVDPTNVAAWDQTAEGTARAARDLTHAVSSYMVDRRAGVRAKKDFWKKETSEQS